MTQTKVLTRVTHVNGWEPVVYIVTRVKLSFVSRIEFIRSKLSNFSAHVSGVGIDCRVHVAAPPAGVTAEAAESSLPVSPSAPPLPAPARLLRLKSGPHRTRQPVPAPFATVGARPGPFRPVKAASQVGPEQR